MSFLSSLLERAQSFLGIEHKPTETHAVAEIDRFDHAYWDDVRHNVPPIDHLITDLGRQHDYVEEFVEDLFHAAYKADPHLTDSADMKPSHVPNHTMVGELSESQAFQSLRASTKGDEYGSAMAVLSMESAIRETQRIMTEAKKAAEEAQDAADDAQAKQDQFGQACAGIPGLDPNAQGPQPDPNGQPGQPGQGNAGQSIQDLLDQMAAAQQAAADARSQAQNQADQAAAAAKAALKQAAQQAAQDLQEEGELMSAFGVDDGELRKMNFEERRQLAQALRNNRLAKFYKLLGQFKMVQQAESRRKVQHAADEVVGVKLGNNLQRIIPAEMLNVATPELEDDFWLRWANHELLEYDLRGKEKLGQGPVIVVVDESGSMSCEDVAGGSREAWSKALALALCDQARQKNRDFHYIGFSSSRQQWLQSFPGGKTTIQGVLTMTEHFWGGGTHYESPLRQALELIELAYDDKGKPKPDIVFITDDEYGSMDEDFMREWHRVKDKTDVRCFGVALGCGYSGALAQVSDNVRSIAELVESDPRAMADLFRTI